MTDEEGVVEFLQVFSGNDGWVVVLTAAAEGWRDLGVALAFRGWEQVVGHVFDEDAFALDLVVLLVRHAWLSLVLYFLFLAQVGSRNSGREKKKKENKEEKKRNPTNLILNIVKRLQRVPISSLGNTTGLSARRIILEARAHTLWAKIEGIAKRLVLAGERVSTGHEDLGREIGQSDFACLGICPLRCRYLMSSLCCYMALRGCDSDLFFAPFF